MTINAPVIKSLQYRDLTVDPSVQRTLNEGQARKIAEDFRPEAVGTLQVSQRPDGTYHVMDGQTRRAGALEAGRGDDLVTCAVYQGLDKSEEAALFRLFNDRRSVGTIDKFLVRVVEGEPTALRMNIALSKRGWSVGGGRISARMGAVAALEKVFTTAGAKSPVHGDRVMGAMIGIITDAWGHDPDGMRAEIVSGLGTLLARHAADADLPKLMREMAQFEGGPLGLVGRAKALRSLRGGRMADNMADLLINLHNKQKRVGRLPEWRSE